ncbi:DUF4166 domain-containing protein [Arthrobacter jiangjiafuii]|uniref:DUF4166 domain-containing protein n=1 Tax=Arthrobacter jiangjiafuii TaxID=2817475 RepID=A0A975M3K6_9MICC|nr:DUF4166 domain-containing protein [Arthrobacter jiangjiafuii]MBP3044588.1 DUF4166 domain-containing protein [Arthrobacter jiangjiafuii]QWC09310.1 DUF4166 domain-containing protein [Arthrobacter jiangjiafuii]
MESVYRSVLGADFGRLQPQLQEYFSAAPGGGMYGEGTGVFETAGCPRAWLRPLLGLIPVSNAFFPDYGTQIPFTIRNYPHLDPWNRPALTAVRTFRFPGGSRVFEDTTVLTGPGSLTDYLGRKRNLATDLMLAVTKQGHLRMDSPSSRLFLGPLRVPLPAFAAADAQVEQWHDDATGTFRITTRVIQRQAGTVFVYDGSFHYATRTWDGLLPADALPARWERRL